MQNPDFHSRSDGPKNPGFLAWIFLASLVVLGGCILSPGNNGKEHPSEPSVLSLSLSNGDTVRTRDLTVTWRGNAAAKSFQFTLDGVSTAWFDSTSMRLTDLAEGEHLVSVQARGDSTIGTPVSVRFVVDAVKGAGIRFNPSTVSATSSVAILFEDMNGLMTAHIEIACSDSSARMRGFVLSDAAIAKEFIVFSDERDPYRLILDIGFPGLKKGFTGAIEFGSFLVSPVKSNGTIEIDSAKSNFRDAGNAPMIIERFETVTVAR